MCIVGVINGVPYFSKTLFIFLFSLSSLDYIKSMNLRLKKFFLLLAQIYCWAPLMTFFISICTFQNFHLFLFILSLWLFSTWCNFVIIPAFISLITVFFSFFKSIYTGYFEVFVKFNIWSLSQTCFVPHIWAYFPGSLHVLQFSQIIHFINSENWSSSSGLINIVVRLFVSWLVILVMSISSLLCENSYSAPERVQRGVCPQSLWDESGFVSPLHWLFPWTHVTVKSLLRAVRLLYCFRKCTGT